MLTSGANAGKSRPAPGRRRLRVETPIRGTRLRGLGAGATRAGSGEEDGWSAGPGRSVQARALGRTG